MLWGMAPGPAVVRDRLGPDTAPYRLLRHEDLPEAWLQPMAEAFLAEAAQRVGVPSVSPVVCVELPDYPWAWHYHRWWELEAERAHQRGERPLPIMVVAVTDFRNLPSHEERRRLAAQVLQSLLQAGIPLPLFARCLGPRADPF